MVPTVILRLNKTPECDLTGLSFNADHLSLFLLKAEM